MKRKNKLPKYWLGTIKPTDRGFQQSRRIGDTGFSTQQGVPVQPEADAARANQFSNTLNKLQQNAQYPLQSLSNMTYIPAATTWNTVSNPITASAANISSNAAIGQSSLAASSLNTGPAILDKVPQMSVTPGKTVVNTLGKTANVLGTLYGAYNIGNDIAHAGDTISQSAIRDSSPINTYTTAGGNTYTQHGGVDRKGILDYENQAAKSKKIGLTLDTTGFGASAGALIGSSIGTIGGPLGMGIGAGAGFLLGGLASLLGFGNNEDKINQMMRDQENVFAMQDRQSESDALDKDIKAAYYTDHAANGKIPVWSPAGLISRKATARVSNGELIGNLATGESVRIPGRKNNKDTKLAHLRDGDFVISNKYGLSDYAALSGDYIGALNMQEALLGGMRNSRGFKNGKLPKCALGWGGILATLPHLGSLATNLSQYNRVVNAETYAPDTYVDNAEGARAVNILGQQRFDDRPYLYGAERAYRQANWNTNRNVGLGLGGRAIAMNANYRNYLDALAGINAQRNDANAKYSSIYAQALQQLGAANQQARINSAVNKHQWMQMANAAKENSIAQYLKNINQAGINGVAEYMKWGQYQDALNAQNRMLALYENQVATDALKTQALINSLGNNTTKSSAKYDIPFVENTGYTPNGIRWVNPSIAGTLNLAKTPLIYR